MLEILLVLSEKYKKLSTNTASESKVCRMMDALVCHSYEWPDDKIGRWLGYVQCLLIEVEHVTTVEDERNTTRPLFHEYYSSKGINIPESYPI